MKRGITAQKEPAGDKTGISREIVLFELHNTRSIIHSCSPQLQSAASAATIITKTAKASRKKFVSGLQSNLRPVCAG
jgi:hypothetical protein